MKKKVNKTYRDKVVPVKFTADEKKKLLQLGADHKSISDFIRSSIFSNTHVNGKEFINQLDELGGSINKVGNNINQSTRYFNHLIKIGKIDKNAINQFLELLDEYNQLQRKLINSLRKNLKT